MLKLLLFVTLLPQACVCLLLLCPQTCNYGNQTFCGHIPCPLPRCNEPLVLTDGDCCQHCPSTEVGHIPEEPTTVCPANCTIGGKHYCFPVPCPLQPCVDPIKTPGDCCDHCPNGPNCAYRGVIIPQGQTHQFSSEQCTCKYGGHLSGIECNVL